MLGAKDKGGGMPMTSSYAQPRPKNSRSTTWVTVGVAALVLLAAVAAAYWWRDDGAETAVAQAPETASAEPLEATAVAAAAEPAFEASPVAEAPAEPAPTTYLRLGSVSGATMVPVTVPLRLEGAEGFSSASIRLAYDPSVVALDQVGAGDVPQSNLAFHHDADAGIVVVLLTSSAPGGVTGDHTFATFVFSAREGAVGTKSPLDLTLRGAAGPDGEALSMGVQGGSFRNGLAGDVLGDGVVDQADYDRLAAYLVGEPVDIVRLNADIDGDGDVTDADALRLHQYLDGTRESP